MLFNYDYYLNLRNKILFSFIISFIIYLHMFKKKLIIKDLLKEKFIIINFYENFNKFIFVKFHHFSISLNFYLFFKQLS